MKFPPVFLNLLSSKKFVFTLVATLACLGAYKFGALEREELKTFLEVLWAVYLGAQGIADVGAKLAEGRAFEAETYARSDEAKAGCMQAIVQGLLAAYEDFTKTYAEHLTGKKQRPEHIKLVDSDPPPTPPSRL